jgi:hypothetical protein
LGLAPGTDPVGGVASRQSNPLERRAVRVRPRTGAGDSTRAGGVRVAKIIPAKSAIPEGRG